MASPQFDRLLARAELAGDLLVQQTSKQPRRHFPLPSRQTLNPLNDVMLKRAIGVGAAVRTKASSNGCDQANAAIVRHAIERGREGICGRSDSGTFPTEMVQYATNSRVASAVVGPSCSLIKAPLG